MKNAGIPMTNDSSSMSCFVTNGYPFTNRLENIIVIMVSVIVKIVFIKNKDAER